MTVAGEFHIVVAQRVARCQLPPNSIRTKIYRLARPERLPDVAEEDCDLALGLNAEILTHLASLGSSFQHQAITADPKLVEGVDPVMLLDRLAAIVISPSHARQEWLECRYVSRRLSMLREVIERLGRGQPPGRSGQWQPSSN